MIGINQAHNKILKMKTVIPLNGDTHLVGESRHGRWIVGDRFSYEGRVYQFMGRDNRVAWSLHARRLEDLRMVEFESSNQWEAV